MKFIWVEHGQRTTANKSKYIFTFDFLYIFFYFSVFFVGKKCISGGFSYSWLSLIGRVFNQSEKKRCENFLSNLPRHMMDIHGITITRDQIYEFDYVLRRFNQLKEEIFGVDYITDLMDSESEVSLKLRLESRKSRGNPVEVICEPGLHGRTVQSLKWILVFNRWYKWINSNNKCNLLYEVDEAGFQIGGSSLAFCWLVNLKTL